MRKQTTIIVSLLILVAVFFVGRYFINKSVAQPSQNGEQSGGQANVLLPVAKEQKITETINGAEINVSYAVFTNVPDAVNAKIKEYIDGIVKDIKDIAEAGTAAENDGLFLISKYEVAQANEKYISLVQSTQEYSGGAHGNQYFMTFNFDTTTGKELHLIDLFAGNKNYLSLIKPKVKAAVLAELKQRLLDNGDKKTDPASLLFDDIMTLDADVFETFTFGEKYIMFYFAPYDIAPYSTGPIVVKIDR